MWWYRALQARLLDGLRGVAGRVLDAGCGTGNMPAFAWLLSAHDRRVHNARRVTAGQLRAWLVRAGFAPVTTRYWNGLLLPLMIVQRKLLARGESVSDVAAYPPWLDATLHSVTEIERRARVWLPAGGSVFAVATRP